MFPYVQKYSLIISDAATTFGSFQSDSNKLNWR